MPKKKAATKKVEPNPKAKKAEPKQPVKELKPEASEHSAVYSEEWHARDKASRR